MKRIGADSLGYLSVEGMLKVIGAHKEQQKETENKKGQTGGCGKGGYCSACFSGEYPVDIEDFASQKPLYEQKQEREEKEREEKEKAEKKREKLRKKEEREREKEREKERAAASGGGGVKISSLIPGTKSAGEKWEKKVKIEEKKQTKDKDKKKDGKGKVQLGADESVGNKLSLFESKQNEEKRLEEEREAEINRKRQEVAEKKRQKELEVEREKLEEEKRI